MNSHTSHCSHTLPFFLKAVLPACMLLVGCSILPKQAAPVIRYYQLDYPAPAAVTSDIAATVQVWPMRIAVEYDRDSLVYREGGTRMGFYQYDHWIAGPADQMTERFARDLRAAGGFSAVITGGPAAQQPAFIVSGAIEELAERRVDGGAAGAFACTITLVQVAAMDKPATIVLQKRYEHSVPCDRAKPESVVAAMSTAAQKATTAAIADIRATAQRK